MPDNADAIARLESQLRLARDRLAAAQSGLFPLSDLLLDRYRGDIARLERELKLLSRE
jgi:hypothetical protein